MSDFCIACLVCALLLLVPAVTYACHHNRLALKAPGYNIMYDEDSLSGHKWNKYLFDHLANRTQHKGIVRWQDENERFKKIHIRVDKALVNDYCIEHTPQSLVLMACDESTALWLVYQLIKRLADEDNRFDAADLPPSIVQWQSQCADFDFDYREPHYSSNMLYPEYGPIIGAHSVDRNWGIWGHNLGKILHRDADAAVYARQGNNIDTTQYCFAGDEIFNQLKEYIRTNFVENDVHPVQFMIAPNDNGVVCDCPICRAAGNVAGNATPAVSLLIKRLAEYFPSHIFFTTVYRTTLHPSQSKWPTNTGVMISTAQLPKGTDLDPETTDVKNFLDLLTSWKSCVRRVYLWDYAANFDDYLTPLPVLYGLKKQLQFFRSYGVSGIFINASGYSYSSFDDMKTFVSSALMMNADLSVDSLCRSYLRQFYPVSWETIAHYYLSLEKSMEQRGKSYPMYGNFDLAARTYFNQKTFMPFYRSLNSLAQNADKDERMRLRTLHAALSFTRLQIAYQRGAKPDGFAIAQGKSMLINQDIVPVWQHLSHYCSDSTTVVLRHYKEMGGDLKQYLHQWKRIFAEAPFSNLLIGENLQLLSIPDDEYLSIDRLNDGILGFDNDYQQGWHLCSTDHLVIGLDAEKVRTAKKITIRFLDDPAHHIFPPQKIEICDNGVPCITMKPGDDNWTSTQSLSVISAAVDFRNIKNNLTIKIFRQDTLPKSSLACDEVCLQEN